MARGFGPERAPRVDDEVDLSNVEPKYAAGLVYWWDPKFREGVIQVIIALGHGQYERDQIYFSETDFSRLEVLAEAGSGSGYSLAQRSDDPMRMH